MTELTVSEIGFGCAGLGAFFGNVHRTDMVRTLRMSFDSGINFYDTADMYCQGESEKLLGEVFYHDRHKVIIASKVGYCIPVQRRLASKIKPILRPVAQRLGLRRKKLPSAVQGSLSQNFSPDYILKAAEYSLKRLKTDYLDLYQIHSPPRAVLESGEFLYPLEKLQSQGKIRYYGVSCENADDALVCLQYPGISALQLRISLLEKGALDKAIPQAVTHNVAIIARECFAGGILARSIDDLKLEEIIPDEVERAIRQNQIITFDALAQYNQQSLPQMALYFALNIKGVSTALLGMTSESHLLANLRHLDKQGSSDDPSHNRGFRSQGASGLPVLNVADLPK